MVMQHPTANPPSATSNHPSNNKNNKKNAQKMHFFVNSFYTDIFCQYEAVILQPISYFVLKILKR
jgi:hypothetical protein